ncbi:hypothetical protein ABT160_04610 [Streptomyces sp. NPDC001941]|uniref:hypothetical protein n=1 Tax=Streptomyces sp. NPDC001941 TaxID=3154659 RepID=UPI00332A8261
MLMVEPVEVLRPPRTTNAYTSRPDWDQAVKVWSGLAAVQPDKAFESFSPARDQSTERLTAYLPFFAVVSSTDGLKVRGHLYEIDGEPKVWAATSRRHLTVSIWRAVR